MNLGQFTERRLLIPRLLSRRQDGAIRELAQRLEATVRIQSASSFLEALLKHESESPALVGDGVAIPHVRGGAVDKLTIAVGLSSPGIPWGRTGQHIAHVIFLVAVPLTESGAYLSLLSGLSSMIQDEAAFTSLKHSTQPEDMYRVLSAVPLIQAPVQPNARDDA